MRNEEIVRALRCVSTAGSSPDCEHCPYWMEESVPAEMRDADTAREGRVYDRHGLHHHPRGGDEKCLRYAR